MIWCFGKGTIGSMPIFSYFAKSWRYEKSEIIIWIYLGFPFFWLVGTRPALLVDKGINLLLALSSHRLFDRSLGAFILYYLAICEGTFFAKLQSSWACAIMTTIYWRCDMKEDKQLPYCPNCKGVLTSDVARGWCKEEWSDFYCHYCQQDFFKGDIAYSESSPPI
jgi:hypothetical protein